MHLTRHPENSKLVRRLMTFGIQQRLKFTWFSHPEGCKICSPLLTLGEIQPLFSVIVSSAFCRGQRLHTLTLHQFFASLTCISVSREAVLGRLIIQNTARVDCPITHGYMTAAHLERKTELHTLVEERWYCKFGSIWEICGVTQRGAVGFSFPASALHFSTSFLRFGSAVALHLRRPMALEVLLVSSAQLPCTSSFCESYHSGLQWKHKVSLFIGSQKTFSMVHLCINYHWHPQGFFFFLLSSVSSHQVFLKSRIMKGTTSWISESHDIHSHKY